MELASNVFERVQMRSNGCHAAAAKRHPIRRGDYNRVEEGGGVEVAALRGKGKCRASDSNLKLEFEKYAYTSRSQKVEHLNHNSKWRPRPYTRLHPRPITLKSERQTE